MRLPSPTRHIVLGVCAGLCGWARNAGIVSLWEMVGVMAVCAVYVGLMGAIEEGS